MSCISRFWNKNFLNCELALSILVGIFFVIWVVWFGGSAIVDNILNGNRSAVYGVLASIFGSLLGFVITALSIIIGYSANEKFEILRHGSKPCDTFEQSGSESSIAQSSQPMVSGRGRFRPL